MNFNLHQSAKGRLRWLVIDAATGQEVRGSDWINNLILNTGMNAVAARSWVDNTVYCCVGTGVGPTADDSGTTTAAQSGNTVTLAGGSYVFDTVNDVGAVIKWDTNETAEIASFSDNQTALVTNSATVGAGQFTLYHTAQTALGTELKRSNTYLTGSPNCGTVISGSTLQHRRTYDFTAEVGTVNYTEAGFSWTASGPGSLFSRIVFPGPVAVLSGQQLRVVYELQITLTPTTPNTTSAIIGGWPVSPAVGTSGQEQLVGVGIAIIQASSGNSTTTTGVLANEPGVASSLAAWISTASTSLPAWPSDQDYSADAVTATLTNQPYVAGTYYRDKTATFTVNQANRSDWRSIGTGYHSLPSFAAYNAVGIAFIFDEAQTKLNTHTLTLTWRYSWSRDLS